MSDSIEVPKPEKRKRGNPNWVKGMKAVNPGGRPSMKLLSEQLRIKVMNPRVRDRILDGLIHQAENGNIQAVREIADRIEGKVSEHINITGSVTLAERLSALLARKKG